MRIERYHNPSTKGRGNKARCETSSTSAISVKIYEVRRMIVLANKRPAWSRAKCNVAVADDRMESSSLIATKRRSIPGERFRQARGLLQGRARLSGISPDERRSTRILRGKSYFNFARSTGFERNYGKRRRSLFKIQSDIRVVLLNARTNRK